MINYIGEAMQTPPLPPYRDTWEEICFILSENINQNIDEKEFEKEVLRAIEKLGWQEYKNDIKRQPILQLGRQGSIKPDLVIYGQEKEALVVVEVKKPDEDLSKVESIGQLKSYMRQMKADFGLLVGNEIRIYYDGERNPDKTEPLLLDKIAFDKASTAGLDFVEIFTKDNLVAQKYSDYLEKRVGKYNKEMEIKKLKKALLSDTTQEKIREFLENEYSDYGGDIFSSAMKTIKIEIADIPSQREVTTLSEPKHFPPSRPVTGTQKTKPVLSSESPILFYIKTRKVSPEREANAKAEISRKGVLIKQGSEIATSVTETIQEHLAHKRQDLIDKGIVVQKGNKLVFCQDCLITSPSTAAGIVMGRSANGRTEWKDEKGTTLMTYQEQDV